MSRALLGLFAAVALVAAAACLGGGDDASPTDTPGGAGSSTATTTSTPGEGTPSDTPTDAPSPTPPATRTSTPTATVSPTPTPEVVPTLDEGKLQMKVLNYSQPVIPGGNAFVTLVSDQAEWCVAELAYSKAAAGPTRLQRKNISAVGQVDWLWRVQASEPQQITVTATCQGSGKKGVRQFTIDIEKAPG